jgi:hypothetical protein
MVLPLTLALVLWIRLWLPLHGVFPAYFPS